MPPDTNEELNLKLDLLLLFQKAGRAQPFLVSDKSKTLRDCLEAVREAGLDYEAVGASLWLRHEVRAAEMFINLGGFNYNR